MVGWVVWVSSTCIHFLFLSRRGRAGTLWVSEREMHVMVSWDDLGRHTGTILIVRWHWTTLSARPVRTFNYWAELLLFFSSPPIKSLPYTCLLWRPKLSRALLYFSLYLGRASGRDHFPIYNLDSFTHSPNMYWTPLLVPILGTDNVIIRELVLPS